MCAKEAKVDDDDQRGHGKSIADDRERPRIARIPFVHQTADRAAIQMARPAGEERAFAAVRAPLADAAPERGQDHCTAISVMSNSSVAFEGIFVGSGDVVP